MWKKYEKAVFLCIHIKTRIKTGEEGAKRRGREKCQNRDWEEEEEEGRRKKEEGRREERESRRRGAEKQTGISNQGHSNKLRGLATHSGPPLGRGPQVPRDGRASG